MNKDIDVTLTVRLGHLRSTVKHTSFERVLNPECWNRLLQGRPLFGDPRVIVVAVEGETDDFGSGRGLQEVVEASKTPTKTEQTHEELEEALKKAVRDRKATKKDPVKGPKAKKETKGENDT